MRRRDVLKVGLIIAAIPMGARMMWKGSFGSRRYMIVNRIRKVFESYMEEPAVQEALTYLSDALDLTFSIVPEGVGDAKDEFAVKLLPIVEDFLVVQGKKPLTGREKVALDGVCYLVRVNYSNRLSEEAVRVLMSACVSAKLYQMRSDLEICRM